MVKKSIEKMEVKSRISSIWKLMTILGAIFGANIASPTNTGNNISRVKRLCMIPGVIKTC